MTAPQIDLQDFQQTITRVILDYSKFYTIDDDFVKRANNPNRMESLLMYAARKQDKTLANQVFAFAYQHPKTLTANEIECVMKLCPATWVKYLEPHFVKFMGLNPLDRGVEIDTELKDLCQFYENHPDAGKVNIDEEILSYNRGKQLAVGIKGVWKGQP